MEPVENTVATLPEPVGLTARQHRNLKIRCRNIYDGHRRRAKEARINATEGPCFALDYTGITLLRWAEKLVTGGRCPICDKPLTVNNLSFDHKQPTSRGGPHAYANIVEMCRPCNQAKGDLSFDEFTAMLATIAAELRTRTLARLRSGNRFFGSK